MINNKIDLNDIVKDIPIVDENDNQIGYEKVGLDDILDTLFSRLGVTPYVRRAHLKFKSVDLKEND